LDRLWSPWRSEYIASSSAEESEQGCVFCQIRDETENDENNHVLLRADHNYVVLNKYPYTSGHLLIVSNEHVADLDAADKQTTDELMDLTKRCQTALRDVYQPTGLNIGMNLGRSAGAGVVDHVHIHILPRWVGDTNFMTSIGSTRVLPEDLTTTFSKLSGKI
jgi:ATP adenylyltransferase